MSEDDQTLSPRIKRCYRGTRCPLKWTCRSCGATCCEHRCANKVGELATCSGCKLDPSRSTTVDVCSSRRSRTRTSRGVSVPSGDSDDVVYRCRCSWVGSDPYLRGARGKKHAFCPAFWKGVV